MRALLPIGGLPPLVNHPHSAIALATPEELGGKVAAAIGNWARDHRETGPGTGKVLKAEVRGPGAIAQGDGALSAGAGGVVVGGDVHGDVIVGAARSDETPEFTLREAYLNRIVARYGYLSLAGIDPAVAGQSDTDTRLNLNAVYTALLTQSPRHEESGRGAQDALLPHEEKRRSALEQLDRHRWLVLQGDPGSGKSTFVNFVALCLAGEGKKDPQVNLKRLTTPLPGENGEDGEEPQPWCHDALLPVPVVLRDFAATALPKKGAAGRSRHLLDFIEAELRAASLGDYTAYLKKELHEHGGLLLLDGLDEVPDAEGRRTQVQQAVEDFVQTFGNCRVLVTSRTYAYQNQGRRLANFAEAVLAPFSNGQIRRFVAGWYTHMAGLGRLHEQDAKGRAALLEQAIFNRPALYDLAQRPLLLTLMASLHAWRSGDLPEKREQLYADTVELLLDFWERRRIKFDEQQRPLLLQPSVAEYLKLDKAKVRWVLETLAFEVHRAQPELTGTADISEGALVTELIKCSANPDAKPQRLVEYLQERAGLLHRRGDRIYTFPHRSFQEYLAACYLTDDDYPDKIAGLARADPDRWREVALLAGAKAARGSTATLWLLAEALCFREPDDSAAATAEVWGAQIAAQALVELADLSRISPANQGKLARIQRWLLKLMRDERLPATERALAGDNLAALGDPRFDAEHWYLPAEPLFGFIEIPTGSFRMGSDKQRDKQAYDDELPQHQVELPGYYLARWPVTVAQFAAFVEASGNQSHESYSLQGVANHPVVGVSWHDALAYCRWLNARLRKLARERLATETSLSESARRFWRGLAEGSLGVGLPSEAEWEKAARGDDGRIYPWGHEPDPQKANYSDTGLNTTSAVGCFPGGASPYGVEEMSGNVWEWTRSLWGENWEKPTFAYPYDPTDGREKLEASEQSHRVLRGGAFSLNAGFARCASRYRDYSDSRYDDFGFRVVVSPFFSSLIDEHSGSLMGRPRVIDFRLRALTPGYSQ